MRKLEKARAALASSEAALSDCRLEVDRLREVAHRVGGLVAAGESKPDALRQAKAELSKALDRAEEAAEEVDCNRAAVELLEGRQRQAEESAAQAEREKAARLVQRIANAAHAKWLAACEEGERLREAVSEAQAAGIPAPIDFGTGGAAPVVPMPGLLVIDGIGPAGPQFVRAADAWGPEKDRIVAYYRKVEKGQS